MLGEERRIEFDVFKSDICHLLKEWGDIEFVTRLVTEQWIDEYWEKEWYPECFYLLAMLDYISDLYEVPRLETYNQQRQYKLEKLLYPKSVLFMDKVIPEGKYKEKVLEECKSNPCSSEFLKYNIIEGDIRDVV